MDYAINSPLDPNKPFCLYANCEVLYEGRASSSLERGNYLVVYKNDRSVSIHGATIVMPRNHMGAGSKLREEGNQILFQRKGETVCIKINHIHFLNYLDDWSESKIVICRTEKELAKKIFDNWSDLFDDNFEIVEMEFGTDLGPIDLVGFTLTTDYIVEVKRKRASLKDVTQLRRYVEAMEHRGRPCRAFLAAPEIAKNAMKYLEKHNLQFLEVNFDGQREG
jgi:RecB family endonuclease NucS